jgi:hypothetical protein
MLGVTLQINSFKLDPQPGWVECSLLDANGQEWRFGMKTAYLYCGDLEETSSFPQPGTVPCELLWRGIDTTGQEIAKISTLEPWGVDSHEGETTFVVFANQLAEVVNAA